MEHEHETWRDRVAERLLYWPFLRMLWVDIRFRIAIVFLGTLAFLMVFSLLKVWRTTPAGFLPEVRVSLLDFGQVWSLRRSAVRAMADGKIDHALYCWEAAAANNPGDAGLIRSYLEMVGSIPADPALLERVAGRGAWLLRLAQTNASDLALVGKTMDHLGSAEDMVNLLEAEAGSLPGNLEFVFCRALVETGRYKRFDQHWPVVRGEPMAGVSPDALAILDAFLDIRVGSREKRMNAIVALKSAAAGGREPVQAARTLLATADLERDIAMAELALAALTTRSEARLQDHVLHWRMLAAAGRTEEAKALALAWKDPPVRTRDVVRLVQVRIELGLKEAALETCREGINRPVVPPEIWLAHGSLLMELRRWADLRQLSVRIRVSDGGGDRLGGYPFFLEGRAELGLGQSENAQRSFRLAAAATYSIPQMAQAVAMELLKLRYPTEAGEVLQKVEATLAGEASYWMLVFEAADLRKDAVAMLRAGERAHALAPEDPIVVNNYAAALLILREKPELAARLTMQLLVRHPNAVESVVNHAEALLLNHRLDEAERLLARVDPKKLTPAQSSLFHFDRFELALERGHMQEARTFAKLVAVEHLYPPQQTWFSNALARIMPVP